MGAGYANVYKYFDQRRRVLLGPLQEAMLIGDTQIIFDMTPTFTVETMTYSNVGVVYYDEFKEFFERFPDMKKCLMDEIIWNPYDKDREAFV